MQMTKSVQQFFQAHKAYPEGTSAPAVGNDEPLVIYGEHVLSTDWDLTPRVKDIGTVLDTRIARKANDDDAEMPMDDEMPTLIKVVISTATPDRERDVVMQNGFQFENYAKNPVVLWAHMSFMPPVAQCVALKIDEQGRLIGLDDFVPGNMCEHAGKIYKMVKARFIRTVSVGFRPVTWNYNEERGGYDFLTQEMLEHSFCPIPMNPEAVVQLHTVLPSSLEQREYAQLIEHGLDLGVKPWEQQRYERALKILAHEKTQAQVPAPQEAQPVRRIVPQDVSVTRADKDTAWSAPRLSDFTSENWHDLSDDEKKTIAGHYAYAKGMPPERFSDMSLPHHRASDGAIVWRGVTAAAQRLGQTDLPDDEVARVKAHLGRHYKAFGETAPWDRDENAWQTYCAMVEIVKHATDTTILQDAQARLTQLDRQFFGGNGAQHRQDASQEAVPLEDKADDQIILDEELSLLLGRTN